MNSGISPVYNKMNILLNSNNKIVFKGYENKVQKDYTNTISSPKEGLSNGAKIGITLGAIAAITCGIILHKKKLSANGFRSVKDIEKKFSKLENNLPEVQEKFKEIFLRQDLTKEETLEILRRYKEIEKKGLQCTKEEYIEAVFNEAKKNFQIYNPSMKIETNDTRIFDVALGECPHDNEAIFITKKGLQEDKSKLFEVIHHELRHAKQNECLYHYFPNGNIKAEIYNDYLNNLMNKYTPDEYFKVQQEIGKEARTGNYYDKKWQNVADKKFHIEHVIEERFGKPDINKVPEEYRKTIEQINKELSTTIPYPNRTEEKDAFKIGNMIRDLIFK